jgi:hypothetical protein
MVMIQEMIDILEPFYMAHYNFGIIGALILLFALYLGSRKNVKGVFMFLCIFLVYNLVLFNKTKRNPDWYDETEASVKSYDPVKELWNAKPADDDVNKHNKK